MAQSQVPILIEKVFKNKDLFIAKKFYADKQYEKLLSLVHSEIKKIEDSLSNSPQYLERLSNLDILKSEISYYTTVEEIDEDVYSDNF